MNKPISPLLLVSTLGGALLGLLNPAVAATSMQLLSVDGRYASAAATSAAPQDYIITFSDAGLLHYAGGIGGYAATAPRRSEGVRKFDRSSAEAQGYAGYLANQRAVQVERIGQVLGRALTPSHHYAVTINGIAAMLSASEASHVAALDGVQSVRLAGIEQLSTYRGPLFIGAGQIWSGAATPTAVGSNGRGIVVGVIDAGANSTHPSFANDAACGFRELLPKLVAVDCSSTDINGYCHGLNAQANAGFGHGAHTASTAAGNTVSNGSSPGANLPAGVNMSGVAPCAKIHQYKVCETNSCDGSSILAAVQNAIDDQVDVLNFSISGGTDPWLDGDRAFLDAVNADIFVAAAAGNLQAGQTDPHGLVNHLGPWLMTVAATTQDQYIGAYMRITGPTPVPTGIASIALTAGSTNVGSGVDQSGLALISYPTNLLGCTADGGFPANYFSGAVAIVKRGSCPFAEKISNAATAGARMVLVVNDVAGSIVMDTTGTPAVPAFSITKIAGNALLAFVAPLNPVAPPADRLFLGSFDSVAPITSGASGWYRRLIAGATQADVLADFSLRGPSGGDSSKPDIAAPGVNTYAALDSASGNYGYMSGTSMASPHVAGAAALIRAVHPDWSVQEVKSALMMTASNANGRREDGITPWLVDDVGSGRADLSKAALAGLTMDESYANFVAADPEAAIPGAPKTLNVPSLRDMNCAISGCTWTRTVKNRLASAGQWTATTTSAASFSITVSPASFSLAAGATQVLTFTALRNTAIPLPAYGNVVLTESAALSPPLHVSVAIRQPPEPDVLCTGNACRLQVDTYGSGIVPNAIGLQTPNTMMWLNRFSPTAANYPITLTSVQTAFVSTGNETGDRFDVHIYQDYDANPANGAVLKASVLGQQITATNALQTVTIPGGVVLSGSGDILVAIVAVTTRPMAFPASFDDGTAYQKRSWIGGVGSTIPASPNLATLGFLRSDRYFQGQGFHYNWIIRAQGSNSSGPIHLSTDNNGSGD